MFYAVAVPEKGGETSVCNSRAAYEALPEDLKRKIDGMKTENTLISSARFKNANPDIVKDQLESTKPPTIHPLVRTHPDTGTKAVWFHKSKTETVTGLTPEETQEFLQDLTDKITQPQFLLRSPVSAGRPADHRRPCVASQSRLRSGSEPASTSLSHACARRSPALSRHSIASAGAFSCRIELACAATER